jgi:hypothetical protein
MPNCTKGVLNERNSGFTRHYPVQLVFSVLSETSPYTRLIFLFLLLYLQFMSWRDLCDWQFCVAMNMWHSGATQRQQQSRVFPLVVCCATLTVAGSSNYSIDDCLVSSVSVRGRERTVKTMRQIVTVCHQRFRKAFPRREPWEKRTFL